MPTKQTSKRSVDPQIIKLTTVSFGKPPFRKLGSIDIEIASRLTLIAGRNGVGKSTILAFVAGSSGITRGARNKTYFGPLPNHSAEDILKLSFDRDFVADEAFKPHVLLTYQLGSTKFRKKGNVSGTQERLRVVPRNEPKGECIIDGLVVPADGKVPIPTIYLGMTRVFPIGEVESEAIERKIITMDEDDYRVYSEFTERVISTGNSGGSGNVTYQVVKGIKKRSVYPDYDGYDSTNVSLGQDSLSSIATALASFNKFKRELGDEYRGGLLVIDELDAGFHPHAQVELLNELKSKARELKIQVVATTHSLTMLEHSHQEIYDPKRTGRKLDQIVYLKGGRPIELLNASSFDLIYADMHLQIIKSPGIPSVKVYLEDDEAGLFLKAILSPARRAQIRRNTGYKLDVIPVGVGCSSLVGLVEADEYFKTVVIVLDGDADTKRHLNIVRLPGDPFNKSKQAPEVIIKSMCEKLCAEDTAYPETRRKLKSINADTSYIQANILASRRGEKISEKGVEKDRDVAKNWFNARLPFIKQYKLIEGWVADNDVSVSEFIVALEQAVMAACARGTSRQVRLAKPR